MSQDTSGAGSSTQDREAVSRAMGEILEDMSRDWEVDYAGGIRPETRLIADLGFESVDVVQLVAAIEGHYGRRDFPFAELLMRDGRFVDDLRVGEIVDFLVAHPGRS